MDAVIKKIDDETDVKEIGCVDATIGVVVASTLKPVSFTKFLPIFNEVGKILDEIITLVEDAEHNKRTYFHRDIRAENVLIILNEVAKLKLSHYLTDDTLYQKQTLGRARYCAPEMFIGMNPYSKYDQRCEVYSFGILLWEIAEETIPKNSQVPKEFKQLEMKAVHQDPYLRPKITKMFEVLSNCVKNSLEISQDSSSSSGLKPR
ncbi:hypothetical protein RclHR1_02450008 [Rhizophagus clarus]|uniref:Protein kinase domain-containing protein n=1 Tax=Rhizophagus clarus TaxID=94130 RepID=A0A2Z6QZA7_9GLOM|nr:hypothetical protein RclHR1_02450008 [Rhizophagus clarus]